MKTILTIAAAFAALTSASASFANTTAGGHWKWQSRMTPGPNRSNLPQQVRIWVKDSGTAVADCNCNKMKMTAADCMMDMPGMRAGSSAS